MLRPQHLSPLIQAINAEFPMASFWIYFQTPGDIDVNLSPVDVATAAAADRDSLRALSDQLKGRRVDLLG
jgi:hypothetical protein